TAATTTATTTTGTTTTAATTTATTTTVTTTTATTSTASTTSTTTSTSTTTTTQPAGEFTRTLGFYKSHPAITESILNSGALTVCGFTISDVGVDDAHSAIEALCVTPQGDQQLQLIRQLVTAALNGAGGGAQFAQLAACNAICQDPNASADD